MTDEKIVPAEEEGFFSSLVAEIIYSPLNIFLLSVCLLLIYKIFKSSNEIPPQIAPKPSIPKLKRQDFTLEQLKKYDGTDEHGRVCVAVNGKVFDVTKGRKFYGPGGAYSAFAGHDASRALATFSVKDVKEEYDDLSDLSSIQMESVREWEMQFNEKYEYIGRFLKPGEEPNEYSDEEDDSTKDSAKESSNSHAAPTSSKKED